MCSILCICWEIKVISDPNQPRTLYSTICLSDNEGGDLWLLRVPRVSERCMLISKKIFPNTFEVRGSLWKKLKDCKKQKVGKCWLAIAEPMLSWPHHSGDYLHLTYGSLGPFIVHHGLGGGVEPFFLLLKYRPLIHSEGVSKTSSLLLNPLSSSPSSGGWFQTHSHTDVPDNLSESQKQRGKLYRWKRLIQVGGALERVGSMTLVRTQYLYMSFMYDIFK